VKSFTCDSSFATTPTISCLWTIPSHTLASTRSIYSRIEMPWHHWRRNLQTQNKRIFY
jgi:hypothetical protein